jgi:malate dehydrogenase (oxaloacetate-decarboxylating)
MIDVKAKAKAIEINRKNGGKLEVIAKVQIETMEDLAVAYTPGVAAVCMTIADQPEMVYELTTKRNLVAVITDGSAVLGLGNIGPEAAIPVMEGKAALFKRFANVDAIPLSLATQDVDEIVAHVTALAPSFCGINLEDISAPRCFEIERRLIETLDIPVFHDDQHGTAIVVLAAVLNSLKLIEHTLENVKIVINGGGAAGLSIASLLLDAGAKHVTVVDKIGIISATNPDLPDHHQKIATVTNLEHLEGTLEDAVKGADIFIGVSAPNVLNPDWIKTMTDKPIIFAMANPEPEIMPDVAKAAGAYIVGTGRSDFPNQINNVIAFPGIFREALDVRAKDITIDMQIAAARGIADIIPVDQLNPENIIPEAFHPGVAEVVAKSVRNAVKK